MYMSPDDAEFFKQLIERETKPLRERIEKLEKDTQPHEPADVIAVPRAALEWLFGEAPDIDGKWFGEDHPLATSVRAKPYWWRSRFLSMIPAFSRPPRETPSSGEPK